MLGMAEVGHSQNINWRSLGEDQQNVVQLTECAHASYNTISWHLLLVAGIRYEGTYP